MHKQYKVRYRDNQHTKVTTSNMVPVFMPDTEDNPEDINVTTEDIEEDTGLTQQMITVNPTPPHKEVPVTDQQDTDPSPWSDEDKVSSPEYPEQPNDSDENPGSSSQTVSNTEDELEVSQSQQDDPEEPNDTWYHDSLDISTGTTQNSDPSTHSDMGQEGTLTPHKETLIPEKSNPGFEKTTQGRENQGGLTKIMWGL